MLDINIIRRLQKAKFMIKLHIMLFKRTPDVFEKCSRFTTARKAIAAGFYPYFHSVESAQGPEVIVEGRQMIMLGSNNYLGLTYHEHLKKAAIKAIEKYGVGCVGSRFLTGNTDLHEKLEKKLAEFVGKEAALVFSTGMQTNLGTISVLVGENDVAIIDKFDHASIIDGCRLSLGRVLGYKHNDMKDLERVLSIIPNEKGKLIIVDGVFSMEGDIANLPEIVKLAKKYKARVMVDDAHGLGVMGPNGRGTCEHFNLTKEVDIIMGTFSKSFASIGGFIAADEKIIHYVKHHARSLIFSASFPPSCVASVLAALEIIKNEPERREQLWKNTKKMQEALKSLGFDTGFSQTPIIPIIVGEQLKTGLMWRALFDKGIFTTPIISPAVPEDRTLIRTSYMATHTEEHLERVLDALRDVGRKRKII